MFFRQSLIASLVAGAAVTSSTTLVEAITPSDSIATFVATATVTTTVTAVVSAIIQDTSTTRRNTSTIINHQATCTPTKMMTVTKPDPTFSKRREVQSWQPLPTAATSKQDVKIVLSPPRKFEIYGKGFVYTKKDAQKLTKLIKKCRIRAWELVYGDDLSSDFKDHGWDFYGHLLWRGEKNLPCFEEAVTSLGGPDLDLAPVPAWTCRVKYAFFTDRVVIKGTAWNSTLLDKDGVPGKGLHDEIKHCGRFSAWSYEQDVDGWDFVAKGITTVWQELCIDHAIRSAGAPSVATCH